MAAGRVVVVSGDAARRRSIRNNLFVAGYAVLDVPNRTAAIEACEDFRPGVVVVDLYGSARRAAERTAAGKPHKTTVNHVLVRQLATRFPDLQIVALCGDGHGPTTYEAVQAGARDYVKEPLCMGELLVRVDRLLGLPTKVKRLHRKLADAERPNTAKSAVVWKIDPPPPPAIAGGDSILGAAHSAPEAKASYNDVGVASKDSKASTTEGDLPDSEDARKPHGDDAGSILSPRSPSTQGDRFETPSSVDASKPSDGSMVPEHPQPERAPVEVVRPVPPAAPPERLGDLVADEHITLVWVGLQGLDRVVAAGVGSYASVSSALAPVLQNFVPHGTQYWAGSEAVAVVCPPIQTPVELAVELKQSVQQALDKLGISDALSIRTSAITRRWGEGKALFLARATGRISNGALPVSPHVPGSEPHVSVTLPAKAALSQAAPATASSRPATQAGTQVLAERGDT